MMGLEFDSVDFAQLPETVRLVSGVSPAHSGDRAKLRKPEASFGPFVLVADEAVVEVHIVGDEYTGWGPKPMVAVDIFRAKDGKVVEHWDVMQEEVPAKQTASGNAMFASGK
jgi:hypothetical protein